MTEHRSCSLCCGMGMVSMSNGLRVPCPACSFCSNESNIDAASKKPDTYDHQSSIVDNIQDSCAPDKERESRSEKMKRSWIERKAKAAEAAAK